MDLHKVASGIPIPTAANAADAALPAAHWRGVENGMGLNAARQPVGSKNGPSTEQAGFNFRFAAIGLSGGVNHAECRQILATYFPIPKKA